MYNSNFSFWIMAAIWNVYSIARPLSGASGKQPGTTFMGYIYYTVYNVNPGTTMIGFGSNMGKH